MRPVEDVLPIAERIAMVPIEERMGWDTALDVLSDPTVNGGKEFEPWQREELEKVPAREFVNRVNVIAAHARKKAERILLQERNALLRILSLRGPLSQSEAMFL